MINFIKRIWEWIRKYLLDCIVPYDSPCVETDPLLVNPNPTEEHSSSAIVMTATQAAQKDDTEELEMQSPVKNRDRRPSNIHNLPSRDADRALMITGGYLGRHNQKIMNLVNKFNGVDSDEEDQHAPSYR